MVETKKLKYAEPLFEGASEPKIVCAANYHLVSKAICLGARHHDTLMNFAIRNREEALFPKEEWNCSNTIQGFVDQFGRFLDREESWLIACTNNQIIKLVGSQTKEDFGKNGIKLYSENLY